MSRTRKKYWHVNEVNKDLAIARAEIDALIKEANRLCVEADLFDTTKNPELLAQAIWNKERAAELTASANRIEDVKCSKLIRAAAALGTPPLFGQPEPVLLEDLD